MSSTTLTTSTGTPGSQKNPVTLRYFAWVREKVGHAEETVSPPLDVTTIADLIEWLRQRGDAYGQAFARPEVIRAAIDQTHVRPDSTIRGAREIAFFPPVTGG